MFNSSYDRAIDYFAVLGVHFGACDKTVKLMYRKMARRYHPDVSTIHNANAKFQEISAAYEVLKKYREPYCREHELYRKIVSARAGSAPGFNRWSDKRAEQASAERSKNRSEPKTAEPETVKPKTEERKAKHKTEHYEHAQDQSAQARRTHKPIAGKDRLITYPLTLRYAVRLLKQGTFYIPGLKVKMKFTREAFDGKTFRLQGKGYSGLFGGQHGDFLVRFNIQLDSARYQLKGADIYGEFLMPSLLVQQGKVLELEAPTGRLSLVIPAHYSSNDYIKVYAMGLPGDQKRIAGDFYARLQAV